MMIQKVIITLMIIYLAICFASIVKFVERGRFTGTAILLSLCMPVLLLKFMSDFFVRSYVKSLRSLTLPKKIFGVPKFAFHALQLMPLVHTAIIDAICYCFQREMNTKGLFSQFKLSTPVRVARENLREKISSTGEFA